MGPSVMMPQIQKRFLPLSNSTQAPLIQSDEQSFSLFFAKDNTKIKPIIFQPFIPLAQAKLVEGIEKMIWEITNEFKLLSDHKIGVVEEEVEDIATEVHVHLSPKRTAPAIIDARLVGRAEPVVTLDFVDDEIIDW